MYSSPSDAAASSSASRSRASAVEPGARRSAAASATRPHAHLLEHREVVEVVPVQRGLPRLHRALLDLEALEPLGHLPKLPHPPLRAGELAAHRASVGEIVAVESRAAEHEGDDHEPFTEFSQPLHRSPGYVRPVPGSAEALPASPEISPAFVARASRCRCDKAHGPKERIRAAEGVADTSADALSKRIEGVRLVTASRLASASQEAGEISGLVRGARHGSASRPGTWWRGRRPPPSASCPTWGPVDLLPGGVVRQIRRREALPARPQLLLRHQHVDGAGL